LDSNCYTSYTKGQEAVDFFVTVVDLFKTLPTYTVSGPPNYGTKRSVLRKSTSSGFQTLALNPLHQKHTNSQP
jgi:hypothetical protein